MNGVFCEAVPVKDISCVFQRRKKALFVDKCKTMD